MALPGPGPVFAYEWLTSARRVQLYATRAVFVGAMLVAIWTVWKASDPRTRTLNQANAELAKNVYRAIVGTQLVLVLLAAPAATAGGICIDRARGTLDHLLVTDLTDAEVVLGRLAARLVPVLTFVGCSLPVVSICALLGGIDPATLPGAYAVTLAVAVLGCSLALTLSVWARKTHEVLLTTYLIFCVWLLAAPMARLITGALGGRIMLTDWIDPADPFDLAFATYHRPRSTTIGREVVNFVVGCLLISTALLSAAVVRLRPVAARLASAPARPKRRRADGLPWYGSGPLATFARKLPGPRLDGNPILWREWHRNRPTGWTRRIWSVYIVGAVVFSLIAFMFDVPKVGGMRGRTSLWVNGFQVAIGLLLLSISAATSLADERARGSLDILMATPLSTRSIVWGKWLGTFRTVPRLAILPTILAASLALHSKHWTEVAILVAEILAYGAFITSVGLAVATWVPRLGRAVALCVTIDVLITVGTFFLIMVTTRGPQDERGLAISLFGGPAVMTADIAGHAGPPRFPSEDYAYGRWYFVIAYGWELLALGAYTAAAAGLYLAALLTFDRCIGRSGPRPWPLPARKRPVH